MRSHFPFALLASCQLWAVPFDLARSAADDLRPSLVHGSSLHAACTSENPKSRGACEGYVAGMYDFLLAFTTGCRSDVTTSALRESVTEALSQETELQSVPAAFAVAIHLTQKFGCEIHQR
jgi:hypothetical protein